MRHLHFQKAWALVHRVACWISRDFNGTVPKNAIEKSMADLNEALTYTSDASTAEEKGCRLLVLLKVVHIISQTKMQVGILVVYECEV